METTSLEKTGKIMIAGAVLVAIVTILPRGLELNLFLSASYNDITAFGPAGNDIVRAFTIHLCSLVIALGLITIGISRHYVPEMKSYIQWGIGIWYVLDSISSLVYGYEYNVIPNTFFLLGFLIVLRSLPEDNEALRIT